MRAVSLFGSEVKFQQVVPEPTAGNGEVLVDVLLAGICETDLQLCNGYMRFSGIIGHEFVGVARSGSFMGKRVVGEINCSCQRCDWCHRGASNHCPSRSVIGILNRDGVFADTVAIPERNLHVVPDSVSNDFAVFAEPLAAALQIHRQVDLRKKRVAVLGDGRLGMLCAQSARLITDEVLVVGKHSMKLERFIKLGFSTQLLGELTHQPSFDVVIDCTGSPTGLETACAIVQPLGFVILKTTVAREHSMSLAPLVINEVTVVGSRCGPFAEALSALESNAIDLDGLISHRFAIDQAVEAMQTAASHEALKVVFDLSR